MSDGARSASGPSPNKWRIVESDMRWFIISTDVKRMSGGSLIIASRVNRK